MFCINEDFTQPLHTLITDLVEGQGGSALLIRMLNRLGACASADTLARYIQQKCTNHTNTTSQCLNADSFFVISADNIDFVHSFARMYKGNNTSNSWSGTSIQAVQPLPSLSEQPDNLHTEVDIEVNNTESPTIDLELEPKRVVSYREPWARHRTSPTSFLREPGQTQSPYRNRAVPLWQCKNASSVSTWYPTQADMYSQNFRFSKWQR